MSILDLLYGISNGFRTATPVRSRKTKVAGEPAAAGKENNSAQSNSGTYVQAKKAGQYLKPNLPVRQKSCSELKKPGSHWFQDGYVADYRGDTFDRARQQVERRKRTAS